MSQDSGPKGERTLEWDRVIPVPPPPAQSKPDGTLEYFEMLPLPAATEDAKPTETVALPTLTLDTQGLDTRLARYLHDHAKLQLPALIDALRAAREARDSGFTLARTLVATGLLPENEVARALSLIGPRPSSDRPLEVSLDVSGERPADTVVSANKEAAAWSAAPNAASDTWQPGCRVGPYLLLQRLGAGAMGAVFLAEHIETHARYALKTLRPSFLTDPDLLARLEREAEAQTRTGTHPNVAAVIETGRHDGRLYLVLEYVPGGTLAELIKQGPLPVERALQITRGLALGLDHMHGQGVLHRDIKPANVMLDPHGAPKLVDFGIAKIEGALTLTATGEVIGTPTFMSPEQAVGDRARFGPKIDVYGVGVLLYVMLTGEYPFKGSTYEVLTQIVMEPRYPHPRELRPEIPHWLESLCLRAMAKDPDDRPTARAIADEIDLHVSGAIRLADPPGVRPRRRRSRGARALTGLAALGAGAGLFALGVRLGAERNQPSLTPVTAASPPPPDATPTPETTPSPTASPQPLAVWRWIPGETRRFELSTTTDMAGSRYGTDRYRIDVFTLFEQRWTAKQVRPDWVTVEVTLERVVVRWEASSTPEGWNPEPMDFDSRRHRAASAIGQAVGRRFELDLDPITGRVLVVRGVRDIQEAIYASLGDADRTRYRIPELSSEDAMQARLDAVAHLLPPRPVETRWSIARGNVLALGATREGRRRGGLRPLPPPQVTSAFALKRNKSGAVHLTWKGSGSAQLKPYPWTPPRAKAAWLVSAEIERKVEGRAELQGGRLETSQVTDTWTMTQTGRAPAGARGRWSGSSHGTTKVSLRELATEKR